MRTFVCGRHWAGARWAARLGVVTVLAAAPGVAASAPANAATSSVVQVSGSRLEFFSSGTARNVVTITSTGGTYVIEDILPIAAGDGCSQLDQTKVQCSGNVSVVQVWTSGGNDEIDAEIRALVSTQLIGGDGDDLIRGHKGDDQMFGGNGADTLEGFAGVDVLDGGDGDDTIHGHVANDVIHAGDGDDTVEGMEGDDNIDGGPGHDFVRGGDGRDVIFGNAGSDLLWGEGEDDGLDGGSGLNILDGGSHSLYGDLCRNGERVTNCERF